ncbi:hypothetical protein BN7_1271 [Wickerhamomyces ciferrii]|uniref:NADH-cytochrome b5 reductase n=1 Tax=Wickerhamomyces ciferrii (strain ATCC 14091 / BCRC 22168 / CBS 111 / JCM 3599 / NBRC 0793 / NRRL Y-1031 F-60-10) TaxID=1206466 RepID=K0KHT8_WICCF|nr:uncharacterized protein BN7_1271 [Wickerhamomyces ciferrii]CCH41732.1 hypothetical protein BN7_1271 [Wickerhamomyces ciferrii]
MSKTVDDKSQWLNEPLHGIYIPVVLMIVGISIMNVSYLPHVLLFLALVIDRRSTLHPENWRALELLEQTLISKDTAIYRFALGRSDEILDIPVGHHVAAKVENDIRYYTPISSKFDKGFFDILVKSYPTGTVSKHFATLKAGQTVNFRGPVGRFNYATNSSKEIGIVAGGSGITPILQVISEVTTTPEDFTKLHLIYANNTANDILLKEELDELNEKYPNIDIHYTLLTPPADWEGEVGYVTKEMVEKYLPKPSDDSRILVCGPQGLKTLMINITKELGFREAKMPSKGDDQVFIF